MPHHLQDLFERALDDEPVPPPGDPVRQAMADGRRIRRRRGLLVGGSAATAVVAAAAGLFLALAPSGPTTPLTAAAAPPVSSPGALMPAAVPGCTWPVHDAATDVSVFLRDDITLPQLTALRDALTVDPAVRKVRFESHSQALQRYRLLWAGKPGYDATVDADALPQSLRAELSDPAGYPRLAATFRGQAGVAELIGRACRDTPR